MTIRQCDLAQHLGVSPMTICRAVATMGRGGEALCYDTVLLLLVAGELRDLGMSWSDAVQLAWRFRDEVRFVGFDPDTRRSWIVSVRLNDGSWFQMTAVSPTHLANIIDDRADARVIGLHKPVARAIVELAALKARKAAAA